MKTSTAGLLMAAVLWGTIGPAGAADPVSTATAQEIDQLVRMLPPDLQSVGAGPLPENATTWYSLQHWPDAPPMPMNWLEGRGLEIYYSPSLNALFVNDLAVDYNPAGGDATTATEGPPDPGGGGEEGGGDPGPGVTPLPPWTAIPGLYLVPPVSWESNAISLCITNTDTNAVAASYDLFFASALDEQATNYWRWLARSAADQSLFVLSNLPPGQAFFRLAATNDTDADGLSDAFERLCSGTDPNTADAAAISFRVSLPHSYVSQNVVTGAVVVVSGYPAEMAVLLDSTNFAGALWRPFDPALALDLGTTEGRKNIWIGLRGPPPANPASWQWRRVTLDWTPPELSLTELPETTSQRVLQVVGTSPEPLAQLNFDLWNDTGGQTNRMGTIVRQDYDTNLFASTTCHFQCYDVPLAPGTNTLTLRARDLAGNITVTNRTIICEPDATAPAITPVWPRDGMMICGDTFLLRAQVDDPGASVTVRILNSAGNTNMAAVRVGRSGDVWASDIPLAEGTNYVTITAMDGWTNSSATNFAVVKSPVLVTINPLSEDELRQPRVTLFGTISDGSYALWVNGVMADVAGANWSAYNVPTMHAGAMGFQVSVYPDGHHPPPDAGGGGLNPPDETAGEQADVEAPAQTRVALRKDAWANGSITEGGSDELQDEYALDWVHGATNSATYWHFHYDDDALLYTWWPGAEPASYEGQVAWRNAASNAFPSQLPNLALERSDVELAEPIDPWPVVVSTWRRHSESELELLTGGRLGSTNEHLFELTVSAWEVLEPRYCPPRFPPDILPEARQAIPMDQIQVGSFGTPGPDGKLWVMLADNTTNVVTPRVDGRQSAGFSVSAKKPRLRIDWNRDITDKTSTTIVGKRIVLSCSFESDGPASYTNLWSIPGTKVKSYDQTLDAAAPVQLEPDDVTNHQVSFFWIDGATNLQVNCTAGVSNRQWRATTTFNVNRPSSSFTMLATTNQPPVDVGARREDEADTIHFGTSTSPGFRYNQSVTTPTNGAGQFALVQLIEFTRPFTFDTNVIGPTTHVRYKWTSNGTNVLDDFQESSGNISPQNPDSRTDIGDGETQTNSNAFDMPARTLRLSWITASVDEHLQTYLMYRPSGPADDTIWVTLRRATWQWGGAATKDTNGAWHLDNGSFSPPAPTGLNTSELPQWQDRFKRIVADPPVEY